MEVVAVGVRHEEIADPGRGNMGIGEAVENTRAGIDEAAGPKQGAGAFAGAGRRGRPVPVGGAGSEKGDRHDKRFLFVANDEDEWRKIRYTTPAVWRKRQNDVGCDQTLSPPNGESSMAESPLVFRNSFGKSGVGRAVTASIAWMSLTTPKVRSGLSMGRGGASAAHQRMTRTKGVIGLRYTAVAVWRRCHASGICPALNLPM